jgi:hypothetical protein
MNLLDKICAVFALLLAAAILLLSILSGVLGVRIEADYYSVHQEIAQVHMYGSFWVSRHFSWLFWIFGWGIIRPIWVAWRGSRKRPRPFRRTAFDKHWRVCDKIICIGCGEHLKLLSAYDNCPQCNTPVLESVIYNEGAESL